MQDHTEVSAFEPIVSDEYETTYTCQDPCNNGN